MVYFGNEFAIPVETTNVYEAAYSGSGGEAARAALEATCTAVDFKGLMKKVFDAFNGGGRGLPKVRVVWGSADRYLDDSPMYKWAEDCRASFDCMRAAGHPKP